MLPPFQNNYSGKLNLVALVIVTDTETTLETQANSRDWRICKPIRY